MGVKRKFKGGRISNPSARVYYTSQFWLYQNSAVELEQAPDQKDMITRDRPVVCVHTCTFVYISNPSARVYYTSQFWLYQNSAVELEHAPDHHVWSPGVLCTYMFVCKNTFTYIYK